MRGIMSDMKIDDGLSTLGYTTDDIPGLVAGAVPQERLTKLAPRPQTEEDLANLYLNSMKNY